MSCNCGATKRVPISYGLSGGDVPPGVQSMIDEANELGVPVHALTWDWTSAAAGFIAGMFIFTQTGRSILSGAGKTTAAAFDESNDKKGGMWNVVIIGAIALVGVAVLLKG